MVFGMENSRESANFSQENSQIAKNLYQEVKPIHTADPNIVIHQTPLDSINEPIEDTEEILEDSLSLQKNEEEMICKALEKHKGKRKNAARELGISERTLYRKIKEYGIL